MLATIDDLLTNARQRMHSRAVAVTAQGYVHTALTSWVSYTPQPFIYYVNGQQYTGTVQQRQECTTRYLLETPDVMWALPLPYRGSFMYDEFVLRVTEFRDFANLVVIGDTVEIVTDERNYIDFEAVLFYPQSLALSSLQQSTAVIECTHQIAEVLRLHNVQVESITEYTRFAATHQAELLGEYILYRLKCKYYQ